MAIRSNLGDRIYNSAGYRQRLDPRQQRAVAHDLLIGVMGMKLSGEAQVKVAKSAAIVVGGIAIILGILFKELNVGYLVGWAFSVAASANLPALIMLLFWKKTTKEGIIASVLVGMVSSLVGFCCRQIPKSVYGLDPNDAIAPFSQPGIITIPLAFITLIVVSLYYQNQNKDSTVRLKAS